MQSGNSQTGGQLEVPETTEQTATAWSSSAAVGLHAEMNPKDTGTSVFTAARFTVAKVRKQPKCAPSDKWLKVSYKYIYIHTHIHTYNAVLLSHKKTPFSSKMDGLGDDHTE